MSKEIIKKELPDLKELRQVYDGAEESRDKAVQFGQQLIDIYRNKGMSKELDSKMNGYLKKLRSTYKSIHSERMPITRAMDEIKSMFTDIEKEVKKGGDGIYDEIVEIRNRWAEKLAKERKKKEQEKLRKKMAKNEVAEVRKKIRDLINDVYLEYVESKRDEITDLFEGITLDNVKGQHRQIKNFSETLYNRLFHDIEWDKINRKYMSDEKFKALIDEETDGVYQEYKESYKEDFHDIKLSLIRQIPSKRKELERIAEADEKERKEMEKKAEERRKQMKAESDQKIAEKRKQHKDYSESAESVEKLNAEMDIDESDAEEIEAKEKVQIEVTHPVGYTEIFQFWFREIGNTYSIDKLDRTKMSSMRKYCERIAEKDGVQIDSEYVKYETKYVR